LRQAVDFYESHQQKIADCDQQILAQLKEFDTGETPGSDGQLPGNIEEALQRMSGVDLSRIDGVSTNTALNVISEIGVDMSRWSNVKRFTSWQGLCPGSKISGDKVLRSATKPVANRAPLRCAWRP